MGYLHINNLYKDDRIFRFDECYALEKIHGTSAHIRFNGRLNEAGKLEIKVEYFSGGENYEKFKALFNEEELVKKYLDAYCGPANHVVTFYGEAYGGKQQGMKDTYGPDLKFIVFDVRTDHWINVPGAAAWAEMLGLEFVDYVRIPTKLHRIDAERDKPSIQAIRNGIKETKMREGVVLRPLIEQDDDHGDRIITKHKNDAFKETKTQRQVDPNKLQILADAIKIAEEWVTPMRLAHVIDRAKGLKQERENAGGRVCLVKDLITLDVTETGVIVGLMLEDVKREAKGEIVESREAMRAIGSATARLFKNWVKEQGLNNVSKEV